MFCPLYGWCLPPKLLIYSITNILLFIVSTTVSLVGYCQSVIVIMMMNDSGMKTGHFRFCTVPELGASLFLYRVNQVALSRVPPHGNGWTFKDCRVSPWSVKEERKESVV